MTPAAAKADQDNATRDSPTCYGTVTAFKIVTQRVFSRYRVSYLLGRRLQVFLMTSLPDH